MRQMTGGAIHTERFAPQSLYRQLTEPPQSKEGRLVSGALTDCLRITKRDDLAKCSITWLARTDLGPPSAWLRSSG